MNYFERLKQAVLDNSYAKTYAEATTEWTVTYYDQAGPDTCVCGKCGLQHRFEITNVKTGKILFPIGSECIKKFDNEKMTKDALTMSEIAQSRNTFMSFQKLTPSDINPNIINYCYGLDAFEDEKDYNFAISFSRRHNFHMYSDAQLRKINYLLDRMENAIIFDEAFYNNQREKELEKKLRKVFVEEKIGKYIKAEDIPPLVMIHLPIEIFEKPEHKDFVLSIYRKIKRKEQKKISEKQLKFFNMLMVKNILPYLRC